MKSEAYRIISEYYGDKRTIRSKVPLINHINEGLDILDKLGSSDIVKDAYCLHPILQGDKDFVKNKSMNFKGVDTQSIILAVEYRRVANSYLSHMSVSNFVGFSCDEVKEMLIADKVQNYKDFMKYHYGTHDRSQELYYYFHTWFGLLEINYDDFLENEKE